MKTMKYNIWCFVILGLLLTACSKDKGNYTYTEVNTIRISTDMDYVDHSVFITADSIELQQNDSLHVKLKVEQSEGKQAALSYRWYVTQFEQSGINPTVYLLDSTEQLHTKIALNANLYKLIAKITDKETGLSFTKSFSMNVATAEWGGEGWLVLQEGGQGADLSVITTRDGAAHGKVFPDVYSSMNGHKLPIGTFKVNIINYANAIRAQKVSIFYPLGGLQLRSSDFADSSRSDSWFLGASEQMNMQYNGSAGSSGAGYEYLMVNNQLAYRQFANAAHVANPPLFFPPYEGLSVAPFVINSATSDNIATLYERNNRSFFVFNASTSAVTNIANYAAPIANLNPISGQGFDLKNMGDNLIYAENTQPINTASSIYWNCFFRDDAGMKTYLVQFPRALTYLNNFTTGRFQLTEANCPGINSATLFANPTVLPMPNGVFYYVNDNKVYTCKVDILATSKAQVNLNFPAGTIIKAMKVLNSGYTIANITSLGVPEGKVLVIATDETASGNGHKVYFFNIDSQTGQIKGSPENPADVYTGFEKIVDIAFKKALGR